MEWKYVLFFHDDTTGLYVDVKIFLRGADEMPLYLED